VGHGWRGVVGHNAVTSFIDSNFDHNVRAMLTKLLNVLIAGTADPHFRERIVSIPLCLC